jgi:hypothetical protein
VERSKEPLETTFKQSFFKPLVFGAFDEMNSSARDVLEMAVEY